MDRVRGREGIGIIAMDHFVWRYGNVGRSSAKDGLATISRVGREVVSGNMNRVRGNAVLGTITGDHFVCGFGTVGRTGAMELLGYIYPVVLGGG
jgi:hypothetical protein